MLKPINWKTFPCDFLRIQIGFVMFALAIALMIRGNVGTNAWVVLEVALSKIFHLTPGRMSIIVGFAVLSGALILREKIGWGTLANILCIGPWEDMWLSVIPSVTHNLLLQIGMLLVAILLIGFASAIYIGVDAGAGPRDSLMLAVHRTTGASIRLARGSIELTVVTIGWLLGGPAGIGTLFYALTVGTSIQWAFKLLKVEPHKPVKVAAVAED